MANSYNSDEQQMLDNGKSNTLMRNGSPVKFYKMKNRGKVWKIFSYSYQQSANQQSRETVAGTNASITVSSELL